MLLGNTRPVVLPCAASATPSKFQSKPSERDQFLVVSTMRASIITWSSGMSRFSMIEITWSMKAGSSWMISVLVRSSTITLARWLMRPGAAAPALQDRGDLARRWRSSLDA